MLKNKNEDIFYGMRHRDTILKMHAYDIHYLNFPRTKPHAHTERCMCKKSNVKVCIDSEVIELFNLLFCYFSFVSHRTTRRESKQNMKMERKKRENVAAQICVQQQFESPLKTKR